MNEDAPLTWRYTPNELREVFAFCQQDFNRFIELLMWLEENMKVEDDAV